MSYLEAMTMQVKPFASNSLLLTASPTITTASVKILDANANRKALVLYNNSANSVYISFTSPANSSTNMTFLIATFTSLSLNQALGLSYTGAVYGIRNAGTGNVLATEFL